jgi:glycosyltransferase involved in cell wall biosynthesis
MSFRDSVGLDDTITVVIPVFNGADWLAEALQSVLKQSLLPNEILVINDGSTDNSAEIAQSFKGVCVHTFENAGLSASRNRGIELAASKWIAFLDHDDLWEPEKLERQMKALKADSAADVCVTSRRYLVVGKTQEDIRIGEVQAVPNSEAMVSYLYRRCYFAPSSVVARRSALLSIGGFDPSIKIVEDWDCWLRLEQAGARFVSCIEPLTLYRVRAESMSRNAEAMYNGELSIYDRYISARSHALYRPFSRLRFKSELLAELAIAKREQGENKYLRTMLGSIVVSPFGSLRRYKIAGHMLLHKANLL